MRILAAVVLALGLAGCGGTGDRDASSGERVERCVDRLVRSGPPDADTSENELRQYAELAYCGPFEEGGLLYDDGALEIGAHEWLVRSGSERCATADAGRSSTTVPCNELPEADGRRRIDCALLRHVRRSEVREYLEDLRSRGEVECDDRTPLGELGAP